MFGKSASQLLKPVLEKMEQEIGECEDAYDLHRQVYRNTSLPLATRLKSATVAIEYERPRLAVTATVAMGGDFADRLERAIARSRCVALLPPVLEAEYAEIEPQGASRSAEHSAEELSSPMAKLRRRA